MSEQGTMMKDHMTIKGRDPIALDTINPNRMVVTGSGGKGSGAMHSPSGACIM